MANTKISALSSATTPLSGSEIVPVNQSGVTDSVSVANLTAGRAVSAASLSLTSLPLPTTSGGTGLTSFTANGVVYANSTSALTTGSGLVFDGNNLGLGITPSSWNTSNNRAFQLIGGSLYSSGTTEVGLLTNAYYSTGGSWTYINNAAATWYQQTNGAHKWYYAGAGTGTISFNQAVMIDTNGNFGIGATSISSKLDVTKGASDGAISQFTGSGANYNRITVSNTSGTAITAYMQADPGSGSIVKMGALTNHPLVISTNDTERARIDTSGNLLVGATSANDSHITGLQIGTGWVQYTQNFTVGNSHTITVSGTYNYWFEITAMVVGNSSSSQIGEARWIAGRRDYSGANHIYNTGNLVNTCVSISTSQSISGATCTYTVTFTNNQDSANNHWMFNIRLMNSNSYSIS